MNFLQQFLIFCHKKDTDNKGLFLFYVEQLFILLLMFKKLNRRLAPKTKTSNFERCAEELPDRDNVLKFERVATFKT